MSEASTGPGFPATYPTEGFAVKQAETAAEIAQARELFLEYEKALGISLCFQGFDKELAGLPGKYAPPSGRLLLGMYAGALAGCAALHALAPEVGEMKRLYLRPAFRGRGLGQTMVDAIIAEARAMGYRRLRLDTIEPLMKSAVAMYRRMGFREIAPYCTNPCEGALYMELDLG
jgi:ribosomal protein S18 acetylase RimI-like enzyme